MLYTTALNNHKKLKNSLYVFKKQSISLSKNNYLVVNLIKLQSTKTIIIIKKFNFCFTMTLIQVCVFFGYFNFVRFSKWNFNTWFLGLFSWKKWLHLKHKFLNNYSCFNIKSFYEVLLIVFFNYVIKWK